MARPTSSAAIAKRATNVSLSESLLTEAKNLGINLSKAAEDGISGAVRRKKEELWLIENREAIESWNEYIRQNGLPLARFRQF